MTKLLSEALFGRDALTSERSIVALRRLRDPSLRPLFSQLAGLASGKQREGDEPAHGSIASPLRRHGILGLAEFSEPARIDLLLVKTISNRDERAALLQEAIDLELITVDDLREVSRWADLRPIIRARTFGQLFSAGEQVEAFRLRELLGEDSIASVYASLLLLEIGGSRQGVAGVHPGDRAPAERLAARLAHAEPEIDTLVEDIRRFRLRSGRPILEALATEPETPPVLRFEAIRSLLVIGAEDPEVCAAWRAAFEHSPDPASRARLGLAALEVARLRRLRSAGWSGKDVFEAMSAGDDPLLTAMSAAGRAVLETPADATMDLKPLLALVAEGHEPSAAWVLQVAADLPAEQASLLQAAVLEEGRTSMREGYYVGAVVEAASLLAASDPARFKALLNEAATGAAPLFVRAALSGALRATPRAGAEAEWVGLADGPTWPDETCAAMAVLLEVRAARPLAPEDYPALAAIAMGRGDLNEGLRVQAAWLALLARGEGRFAMARILADAPE